jgi:hypothetical protein
MTGVSTLARGIDIPLAPKAVVRVAQSVPPAVVSLPRLFLRLFGVSIIGKQRDYLFAVTTPGAVVGVMITGAGKDLYMAWDLFLRRVWNEVVVGLLALIPLVIALFAGLGAAFTLRSNLFALIFGGIAAFLAAFFAVGIPTTAGVFVALALLGWIFKRDPLAFFRKEIDLFEAHDIQSMSLSVHKALMHAADVAGIDQKLLREKREFVTGRDKRVI